MLLFTVSIDSPIRTFLNKTFYSEAFSDDQQELIETHSLPTTGGDVNDKVFILSDAELIVKTGKSQRTITRVLAALKGKGLITRIGSNKTGYWHVK